MVSAKTNTFASLGMISWGLTQSGHQLGRRQSCAIFCIHTSYDFFLEPVAEPVLDRCNASSSGKAALGWEGGGGGAEKGPGVPTAAGNHYCRLRPAARYQCFSFGPAGKQSVGICSAVIFLVHILYKYGGDRLIIGSETGLQLQANQLRRWHAMNWDNGTGLWSV